jgi:hypothetical protein
VIEICNLNILISKDGEQLSDRAVNCAEVMGYMSSEHNKDGSGAIFQLRNGEVFMGHSEDKVRIKRGWDYSVIATHQRISTTGHNPDNLHPYKRDGFLLMHNGIFSGLGDQQKSDSSVYCDKLQAELHKSKDMVAAIQAVHKEVTGSYSVLVYDRVNKRFLYYKNSSTSMTMIEHPKYRIMSTSKDNTNFAVWFLQLDPNQCNEMTIEPNTIYDLGTLQELGKIEVKAVTLASFGNNYYKYDWDDELKTFKGSYIGLTKADKRRLRKESRYDITPRAEVATGEVKRPSDEEIDEWRDD